MWPRLLSWKYAVVLIISCIVISTIFQSTLTDLQWSGSPATNVGDGIRPHGLFIQSTANKPSIADTTRELLITAPISSYMKQYYQSLKYKMNRTLSLGLDSFVLQSGVNIWDLHIPEAICADVQRVGSIGDGGKWVCGISHLQQLKEHASRKCVVYSYGVSFDSSFEDELKAKAGCEIHAFDPTVGKITGSSKGIVFHKHGLAARSGVSTDFMMVESLTDAMHRLGHSFIDILKVDIEGAEWQVFEDLFSHMRPESPLFGQLLIELHHTDLQRTHGFFKALEAHGFVSYSREINLQPCIAGQLPFASEYSFIHPLSFFADYRSRSPPASLSVSWHEPLKGVVYFLSHHRRVPMLQKSLRALYINYLKYYSYPVVIFYDDLTVHDRQILQASLPLSINLDFRQIKFRFPPNVNPSTLPARTICSPDSSTIGYRHMIHLHAIDAQRILAQEFEYIWRLDDDSIIGAPIGYDPFRLMKINSKLYGYVNTVQDDPLCVDGLWNLSRQFMAEHKINGTFFNEWTDGLVFYNNFEISHRSIWAAPQYQQFIQLVDKVGGIYLKRWGDAPLHTIAVSMLVDVQQIHRFTDIAYMHLPFVNQSAGGLPKPASNPLSDAECYYMYFNWVCNGLNGSRNSTNTTFTTAWGTSSSFIKHANIKPRAVIYTFASHGRVDKLLTTLNSVDENFNNVWQYPVIVFHEDLTDTDTAHFLSTAYGQRIQFRKVQLLDDEERSQIEKFNPPIHHECGNSTMSQRALHKFLAVDVHHQLAEYDWLWRIGDNGILKERVPYDIFQKMEIEGYRYGYLNFMRDDPKCVRGLWSFAERFIQSSKMADTPLFREWPADTVFLGDFEVSHRSIWDSPNYRRFIHEVEENGGIYTARWGDAPLHTIGVILSIPLDQTHRFTDIAYEMNIGTMSGVAPNPSHANVNIAKMMSTQPTSRDDLDAIFRPRRFGWLGGDVAASFFLPSRSFTLSEAERKQETPTGSYVWLFGDTLVGTSNGEQRLEATIVSNSVGVAHMASDSHAINQLDYYWRSTKEGAPCAIFECTQAQETPLWPVNGLAFAIPGQATQAVILAQRVAIIKDETIASSYLAQSLRFRFVETVALVVNNPHDSPNAWNYEQAAFTQSNCFQWASMASASGDAFVTAADDYVYMIGSFETTCGDSETAIHDKRHDLFVTLPTNVQIIARIQAVQLLSLQLDRVEILGSSSSPSSMAPEWLPMTSNIPDLRSRVVIVRSIGTSEASLHFHQSSEQWVVVSMHVLEGRITVCTAKQHIYAPWRCVYTANIPEPWNNMRKYTVYGAKYHPELSNDKSSKDIVLSYIANMAGNPMELMNKEQLKAYTPKFITVTIDDH